jgi:hypothetical protein
VKGHTDAAEAGTGEPGAVEGGCACFKGGGGVNKDRKGGGESFDTFQGEEGDYGVGVAGVERFDFGMGG